MAKSTQSNHIIFFDIVIIFQSTISQTISTTLTELNHNQVLYVQSLEDILLKIKVMIISVYVPLEVKIYFLKVYRKIVRGYSCNTNFFTPFYSYTVE